MNSKLKAAFASAALFLSCFAQASPITTLTGLMIGIHGGYSTLESPSTDLPNGSNTSYRDYAPTYGAELGYKWAVSPTVWLGLEGGLNFGGSSTYKTTISGQSSHVKVSQKDGEILLSAGFIADGGFNLFAKAGWSYVLQRTRGVESNVTSFTHGNSSRLQGRPKVELGVGYFFVSNLNLTFSYSHLFAKQQTSFPMDNATVVSNNSVLLGLTYTFPIG